MPVACISLKKEPCHKLQVSGKKTILKKIASLNEILPRLLLYIWTFFEIILLKFLSFEFSQALLSITSILPIFKYFNQTVK